MKSTQFYYVQITISSFLEEIIFFSIYYFFIRDGGKPTYYAEKH
jgi:hypothetical protein